MPLEMISEEGIKYQYYQKVKFEDVPEDIKDLISNGCGAADSFFVPPHAIFFETCCAHHDYGYWVGGTETDRKRCDIKLREAMIKDCNNLPWYKQLRYRPWCEFYYWGVRVSGSSSFRFDIPRWPVLPQTILAGV